MWLHIEAHANGLERRWKEVEESNKWQFYMSRMIAHTVHLHAGVKSPVKSAEQFMRSPWSKGDKVKQVETNKDLWAEYERMKAESEKKHE